MEIQIRTPQVAVMTTGRTAQYPVALATPVAPFELTRDEAWIIAMDILRALHKDIEIEGIPV